MRIKSYFIIFTILLSAFYNCSLSNSQNEPLKNINYEVNTEADIPESEFNTIYLKGGTPENIIDPDETGLKKGYYMIHFKDMIFQKDIMSFENYGISLLDYIPDRSYHACFKNDDIELKSIELGGGIENIYKLSYKNRVALPILEGDLANAQYHTEDKILAKVIFQRNVISQEVSSLFTGYESVIVIKEFTSRKAEIAAPHDTLLNLGNYEIVQWIELVPEIILDNRKGAEATGVTVVNEPPYDLNGSGINAAIFDKCFVFEHNDLAGRVYYPQGFEGRCGEDYQDHPTHIAGTIAGNGSGDPDAKGVAPMAKIYSYDFHFYYDRQTMMDDFITYNIQLSNYSYSWGQEYGAYSENVKEIDEMAYNSNVLMFWSSGNDGYLRPNSQGHLAFGFQTQRNGGLAKNVLSIGNLFGKSRKTYVDYTLKIDSSKGPAEDGRVKPDLCGIGYLYSTVTDNNYEIKSGTSMAAPQSLGAAALVLEHYKKKTGNEMPSVLARLILIHTAEDLTETTKYWTGYVYEDTYAHPGPDYATGWGLTNALSAVEEIDNNHYKLDTIAHNKTRNYEMFVNDDSDLKVTIAWKDLPATVGTAKSLINDIDISLIDPDGNIHYPWVLDRENALDPAKTGINRVDNTEQVFVEEPVHGTWTIKVKGANIQEEQEYAITASYKFDIKKITIFSTSEKYSADLGGRTGADEICESIMPESCSGSSAHALLTTGPADQMYDMTENYEIPGNVPVWGEKGVLVAENWDALFTQELNASMAEATNISEDHFWSGAYPGGGIYHGILNRYEQGEDISNYLCEGFTSSTSRYRANRGKADSKEESMWMTDNVYYSCSYEMPILCVCY